MTGTERARRVAAALCALMLLPAAQASAAPTWTDEAAMVNTSSGRDTFLLDPGRGHLFTRGDLLGNPGYRAYYKDRDLANVLMWGSEGAIDPGGSARWAGCGPATAPGATVAGDCPAGRQQPAHLSPMQNALANTTIHALHYDGAFIALACGNFSERTVPGPAPVISGAKFEDVDGDGQRDPAEPLLAGWTIQLFQGGQFVGATTTDGSGRYRFVLDANVLPNVSQDFEVREVGKPGWVASRSPGAVHVPWGSTTQEFGGNDFGNYRPATITGAKYEDMDADGDEDGDDPRLSGWTFDVAGPSAPAPAVTGDDGTYSVSGLRPGTYSVTERLQSGWRYSAPADGRRTITVSSGEIAHADFGNYRPATIQGVKFDDHDVDRLRAPGEPGLPDWRIELSGGRSPGSAIVTGADGGYRFDGLIPGEYNVAETLKDGWRQSAPATGTHTIRVRSGDVKGGDFGNVCLGNAQVVITDEDTGAPITGVEVRLEEIAVPGVLANEPALPRMTTGDPRFDGLLPGNYRAVVFLPQGVYTTDPRLTFVDGRLAIVVETKVEECAPTVVRIKLFTTSAGKVTGGMKMTVDGGFATAGYVFMTRKGLPEGSLEYQDHSLGMNLHSVRIEQIHVAGNEAWIGGVLTDGGALRRFSLHLVDSGEPGRQDRFELLVEPGYGAGDRVTLEGGNVQIHPTH